MDRPRETRRKGCVGLHIVISNQSGKPIYEQIVEQVKALIISGELKEGDALPSMRLLAKELRISVITTKRAYEELEREGYVMSVPGKGCFVAGKSRQLLQEEKLRLVEEKLAQAVEVAKKTEITLNEMTELLKTSYEED